MTVHRVAITGLGVVSAAVVGGADEFDAWLRGSPPSGSPGPAEDPFPVCGTAVDPDRLAGLVDPADRRRLSRVCQFTVAAARLALTDARVRPGALGLIVGTELGDLRSTIEFVDGFLARGPAGLSPLLFPNTVMNTMAAAAAIAVQVRERTLTLTAPAVAGELAVARAAAAVAAGRLDVALAGGVDELADEVQATLTALGGGADVRGEGATFLVLESLDAARRRGARILGEIRSAVWRGLRARPWGVGRSCRGPAVAEAFARAGTTSDRIGYVYASAAGDGGRDAWEARILASAFHDAVPPTAALSHALGRHAGAGASTVAAAAWTAWTGRWPAIVTDHGVVGSRAVRPGPGIVHAVARGGTHVALVVDRGTGDIDAAGQTSDPWTRADATGSAR